MSLSVLERRELLELLQERERRAGLRKYLTYYPDTGPLRRELYPKHLEFFAAGLIARERLMLAANRIGKTEGVGGYELALHLTGLYPDWWPGRRFDRPIRAWASGKTRETVREILQAKLLGGPGQLGTGMIPGECISRVTRGTGLSELADTCYVKHVAGGESKLLFKSYDQGRRAYEGTEVDVAWEDEEPPLDIHTEILIRTMTTGGMVMSTFTPLLGMSEVVLLFLEGGDWTKAGRQESGRYVVLAGWDHAPHLTAEQKAELLLSIPPHQRDARSRGIPQLGAGAIYQVPESDVIVEPFPVPDYWPQGYGMDVGWQQTAAVWAAKDPGKGVVYLTGEYRRSQAEPVIHSSAIKARGEWIRGVIDPASRGRSQADGQALLDLYRAQGLKLEEADNAVEAGISRVWDLLSTGRLKVFSTLSDWRGEYRLYRRNERGQIVKEHDHLMDATRYFVASGIDRMTLRPQAHRDRGARSSLVVHR